MPLKAELTDIIESQRLTEFLQSILVNLRFHGEGSAEVQRFGQSVCLSYIGSTIFKDSTLVFTINGAYADLAKVLSLLDEVVIQSNFSLKPIKTTHHELS